jgi:phage-related protein
MSEDRDKPIKSVEFLADTLDSLRAFPVSARREAGYQIDRVQHGWNPDDWKPMKTIGPGVREIRIRDEQGAFRIIYVAKLAQIVYVLHAFQKKRQKTSRQEVDLAKRRFNELVEDLKR